MYIPFVRMVKIKLSKPFVTVPNIPITIRIIITCMFHSFFQCPSKVEVLILLFTLFQFYSVVSRDNKIDNFASSLFLLLLLLLLGLVFWPRFGEVLGCVYTICSFAWSKLNSLHISRWIPLPTQSCLLLYSFCANLLHLLIM